MGLERLLRRDGFSTGTATDGEGALVEARRELPGLVVTDLHMPAMDGIELRTRLRELDPDLPVIIMTAFADMDSAVQSLRAGAEDYLAKPLDYGVLLLRVGRAIARRKAKREADQLRLFNEEIRRELNQRLVLSSIREQEHAEGEARRRAELDALLENLGEGVIVVDRDGAFLLVNAAARVMLGIEPDGCPRTVDALHARGAYDLQGRPLPREDGPLTRALRGEEFSDYEILRERADGERRRVVSTGTNVRDAHGNIAMALVVFRDVTELRRLEQQREEYVSLVSHDLRNPLNSILLSAAHLRRALSARGMNEEAQTAERAERNVRRMDVMIEELSERATIDSQGVGARAACDLRKLVADAVERLDETRARRVTTEIDEADEYVVHGNVSRLERVIANLVTNALKYSAEGTPVRLHLARRDESVVLDVVDHGIGIDPASVTKIFDRYYRAHAGQAHAAGFGLGLYIARQIAEAHGGRIEVASEVGKGTSFRLLLPAHP